MAILNNNPLVGASGNQGGYNINNSLRFRSSASAFLNRTFASAGSRTTFTISVWIKRGTLSTEQAIITQGSGNRDIVRIGPDNQLYFYWYDTTYYPVNTTQVFRDPSAWYHIVVSVDTTQATSSNRIRLYVNGNQITALSNAIYPSQNFNFTYWGTTNPIAIGKDIVANNAHLDGYMAEFNFIDGSAKTPSDFGETDSTTGVWKPKAYTGTYGTNGFYLKFSDIATTSGSNAGLGKDFSGNTNYWTTNNISVTSGTTYDAMTDSPTNTSATVANYATFNPLWTPAPNVPSNGNLTIGNNNYSLATMLFPTTGKYYIEYFVNNYVASSQIQIGFAIPGGTGWTSDNTWYQDGLVFKNGANQGTIGQTFTTNDKLAIAVDVDNTTAYFYKNNTLSHTLTGITNISSCAFLAYASVTNSIVSANFGQQPWFYTPPTGYKALNTFNLPTSTILQGNKYMDATLYTGNGTSQTITNAAGFKPDFVWVKSRSVSGNPVLVDSVRGANKVLYSPQTTAEETPTAGTAILSFNSNGFSLGGDISGTSFGSTNGNTFTYVGWQWQAGQGSTSSNTSGSITSTVSVNTTAGFSVVTYTGNGTAGATVGHGLGVAPKMFIVKNRVQGTYGNWNVWHTALSGSQYLTLNATDAAGTNNNRWNGTVPTSTVFSLGADTFGNTNKSGDTYVAYCWAEIAGFSKFGSYTGNFNADGPFIYTGFRPKFVLLKASGDTGSWNLLDATRNPSNVANARLFPNNSNAEATTTFVDFLSNGFKIRTSDSDINYTVTNIYAAFAENPFKNANAR